MCSWRSEGCTKISCVSSLTWDWMGVFDLEMLDLYEMKNWRHEDICTYVNYGFVQLLFSGKFSVDKFEDFWWAKYRNIGVDMKYRDLKSIMNTNHANNIHWIIHLIWINFKSPFPDHKIAKKGYHLEGLRMILKIILDIRLIRQASRVQTLNRTQNSRTFQGLSMTIPHKFQ